MKVLDKPTKGEIIMKSSIKSKIRPKTIILLAIFVSISLWWIGCATRAQENEISPARQAYVDYQNANLDTIAATTPSREINAYTVLKKPINEQQIIEIFDAYQVEPYGLRFESGDGVGGHGFSKGFHTFQEAMNEFWKSEVLGAKNSYELALSAYARDKQDPNMSEHSLQESEKHVQRMEATLKRAENHTVIFSVVTFIGTAKKAKELRDNNRMDVLYIDAQ